VNEQSEQSALLAATDALSGEPPSPGPNAALPQEALRRIAESVRAGFPRPFTRCELVLVDVDPWHIHAFWNIPLAVADQVVLEHDVASGALPLVLRVSELGTQGSPGSTFDVEVLGMQGQYYVDIWGEARGYRGIIGYRRSDGTLIPLTAAADAVLPAAKPSTDDRYSETTVPLPEHGRAVSADERLRAVTTEIIAEAGAEAALTEVGAPSEPVPLAHPVEEVPADARSAEEGGSVVAEGLPLPLEQVLSLSSFAMGREDVQFEVNAELHIFGRARPGSRLMLFGRSVALRPDGTFSITRPLPDGALVLSALLAETGPSQE
jgi:hypothetical protein